MTGHVDDPVDPVVGRLRRLVAASSESGAEQTAVEVHRDMLAEVGWSAEIDEWGNVVGRRTFGPGPVVLHDAHLDTVAVTDREQWRHDPDGEITNGRFVGRGAVDTKASVVAAVCAAQQLVQTGQGVGTLVLVGSVGEELAEGPALRHVLRRQQPDVVVIGEPSGCRLVHGQRGRAELEIEITGCGCHSAFPDAGINAAEVMSECIVALRDLHLPEHSHLGRGLLTLTNLNSHPSPSQSTVPSRCVAVYDRRTLPGEDLDQVVQQVSQVVGAVADRHAATAEVRIASSDWTTWTGVPVRDQIAARAWEVPAETTWLPAIRAALAEVGVGHAPSYWPFCTNGSASSDLGIPTIGLGPGDPVQAHVVDEGIELSELACGVHAYTTLFRALLSNVKSRPTSHKEVKDD